MSGYQGAHDTGIDVLSIGSEGAMLPRWVIELAKQYCQVFVWADEEEAAKRFMGTIPGAIGVKSPRGKDANDLLKEGLLGGFLAAVRERVARNGDEREALLWGLYDASMLPAGIDSESAKVLRRLARQLGKKADIYQPYPEYDRWITRQPD